MLGFLLLLIGGAGMRSKWYTSTSVSVMIQGGNGLAQSVEIEMPGTFFSGTGENI